MTKPMTEPSVQGDVASAGWRIRQLQRRPGLSPRGQFDIKIFADDDVGVTGYTFFFPVPLDLGESALSAVYAAVLVAPSEDITIMVHNLTTADDMLIDPLMIDSGDTRSSAATTPATIDPVAGTVTAEDFLQVQIVAADGGATGLVVILDFA